MSESFTWTCRCGTVRATVAAGPTSHVVCYCRDCQAYARHLHAGDALDAEGGTDLCATVASRITIEAGADRLACLRMTRRGPLRWYAACCGAPLANTAPGATMPYAGVVLAFARPADAAGPVEARLNLSHAQGRVKGRSGPVRRVMLAAIGRTLLARLAGRHRPTPFFDADGRPVAAVGALSASERAAAYADGPVPAPSPAAP